MTKHPKVGDLVVIDAHAHDGGWIFPRRHPHRGKVATVTGWDRRDIDLMLVDRHGAAVVTRARLRFLQPVKVVALT